MSDKTVTTWPKKPLSEVVELNPRLVKSAYRDDLEVSFVPMAAVEAGSGRMDVSQTKPFSAVKKGYTPFKEGDVLFAKITPCMENGKMAVVPKLTNDIGFGSTEFHVLRPNEGVDPRYVYYFVSNQSFRRDAAHQMTGAVGQKRVPQSFLEEVLIPVPCPEEQISIVAEIEKQFSRLDEAVASLKRTKANLKRYQAAVLKAAVEGKLTENWRKAHPDVEPASKLLERILAERQVKSDGKGKRKETLPPDLTDLPPLPSGWTWASLEWIGQHGRPIIYGIIKPGPHISNGVPYVRVTEMKDGRIDIKNLRRTSPERAAKFARATLASGDILISKDGTIGRVAVVPPELEGGNITQHVMRAPVHSMMVRNFVVWAIRSDYCQRWLTGETRGVALQGVNVEDFRRLPIPIPPREEQEQIVAEVERRLSVIDELEAVVEANLTRAERLRQSVLTTAFSGTLTVGEP